MKPTDAHTATAFHEARKGTEDTVLLEGIHACKHAIRFGARLQSAYTNNITHTLALMRELAGEAEANALENLCKELPDDIFNALTPNAYRAGLVALAAHPYAAGVTSPAGQGPIILLEDPRDLENVGATIRVAAGFGAAAVLTSGTINPWHGNCIRASAGLHFALPVIHFESVEELPKNRPLVACTAEGENMYQTNVKANSVLAFGSERHGLSSQTRKIATQTIAIPMQPRVSSLNLATSVAAVLYGAIGV